MLAEPLLTLAGSEFSHIPVIGLIINKFWTLFNILYNRTLNLASHMLYTLQPNRGRYMESCDPFHWSDYCGLEILWGRDNILYQTKEWQSLALMVQFFCHTKIPKCWSHFEKFSSNEDLFGVRPCGAKNIKISPWHYLLSFIIVCKTQLQTAPHASSMSTHGCGCAGNKPELADCSNSCAVKCKGVEYQQFDLIKCGTLMVCLDAGRGRRGLQKADGKPLLMMRFKLRHPPRSCLWDENM